MTAYTSESDPDLHSEIDKANAPDCFCPLAWATCAPKYICFEPSRIVADQACGGWKAFQLYCKCTLFSDGKAVPSALPLLSRMTSTVGCDTKSHFYV